MVSELLGESWSKEKPMDERKAIRDVAGVTYAGKSVFVFAYYF